MMQMLYLEGGPMRKRDEDLKIDISDIFGGEVQVPAETEGIGVENSSGTTAPSEKDDQFQEWMNGRDEALQAQTHELERKLHDTIEAAFPQAPDDQVAVIDEVPVETVSEPLPAAEIAKGPESPIDFSAPIAPP